MNTHLLLAYSLLRFSSVQNFLPLLNLHFSSQSLALLMAVHGQPVGSHWGVTGKDNSAAKVESQRPNSTSTLQGKPQIWEGDWCFLRVSTKSRAGGRIWWIMQSSRAQRCRWKVQPFQWSHKSLWEARVMLRRKGWSCTSPSKGKKHVRAAVVMALPVFLLQAPFFRVYNLLIKIYCKL